MSVKTKSSKVNRAWINDHVKGGTDTPAGSPTVVERRRVN